GICKKIRHRKRNALFPLGAQRGSGNHRRALCSEPAYGRAETVGKARRSGRLPQPRRLSDLERLLRVRNSRREEARAAAAAVRRDDLRVGRTRVDHRLERRGPAYYVRMEDRVTL